MDQDELDIHAEWMDLKLERILLQRRIHTLEGEIATYKQRLADLLLHESKQRRHMRRETREKWQFYHENKDTLGDGLSWRECKRLTDHHFQEHKKSVPMVDVHSTRPAATIEQPTSGPREHGVRTELELPQHQPEPFQVEPE